MIGPEMILIAILIDAALSWPAPVYARIGHPVTWIGALISALERRLNTGRYRKAKGGIVAVVVIGITTFIALTATLIIDKIGSNPAQIYLLNGILAWPFIATRSMYDHVRAVVIPLAAGDLDAARHAVSMIVGRDPSALETHGVARAAIESLAENTSDGIVAPVFWGLIAGLPGIAAYKAINTLDSMIGHRTPRYNEFGWASAKIDDVVNLIPARLTGLLFALSTTRVIPAIKCMGKDARHHRSPNAGWPEAAMAGALDIRLSGPRSYEGRITPERWVNGESPDPTAVDLTRGLHLYLRAMGLMTLGVILLAGL